MPPVPDKGKASDDPASASGSRRAQEEDAEDGKNSVSQEAEPLLYGPQAAEATDAAENVYEQEESRSTAYLVLLNVVFIGMQIVWSVELSSISPFLLSLGLSKSLLALVWIAGPLSGTLVQPYVGIKSDNTRSRWGRRTPYMVGGAGASIVCLLALCWTPELVDGVLGLFGADIESRGARVTAQAVAILLVYVLDFAINTLQAAIRALVVDCVPTHQQDDANAWSARTLGIGHIAGYLFGYVELGPVLPFLGHTQFQVLCAIACVIMAATLAITCLSIREPDPGSLEPAASGSDTGTVALFRALFQSVRRLPPQIRRICAVQVFAWIGWFPFMFYITTYIGGLYADPFFAENPNMTEEEINAVWERGTRLGSFALLVFALTTFASSVVLPVIIPPSYTAPERSHAPRTSDDNGASDAGAWGAVAASTKKLSTCVAAAGRRAQIPSLTLRRAWLLSHVMFAVCMWLTFFVRSTAAAVCLVGVVGVPWAMTNWAPFALIASEISKRHAVRKARRPPPPTRDGQRRAAGQGQDDAEGAAAEQAGVVLGIHNVAIAAPQVLATLASSVIFQALQKPRGAAGDDSVGWVLRFGGVCAIAAAWCARYVADGGFDGAE